MRLDKPGEAATRRAAGTEAEALSQRTKGRAGRSQTEPDRELPGEREPRTEISPFYEQ